MIQHENKTNSLAKKSIAKSIFREKDGGSAPVTPNSSGSSSGGPRLSRERAKYDEALPSRYYENDNRLSWEFEDNPPIGDFSKDDDGEDYEYDAEGNKLSKRSDGSSGENGGDANKRRKTDGDDDDYDD
jgi:hypothetical protein